ncbi:MAG: DUF5644 domain-containing protein, partial [Campylobacter sp.]|nr:DUF5644 domain-containing protein [Campylobacter sp.]
KAKFALFKRFCTKEDGVIYESLKPYFYAGFMNELEPDFIGASAVIFAKILCEKYPDKKDEILAVLNEQKYGVWIASELKNQIFWSDETYNEALTFVNSNL